MSNFSVQTTSNFALAKPLGQAANFFLQSVGIAGIANLKALRGDVEKLRKDISPLTSLSEWHFFAGGAFRDYHNYSIGAADWLGDLDNRLGDAIYSKDSNFAENNFRKGLKSIKTVCDFLDDAKKNLKIFLYKGTLNGADRQACHKAMEELNGYIERADAIKNRLYSYDK